jgi:hypothetical protein
MVAVCFPSSVIWLGETSILSTALVAHWQHLQVAQRKRSWLCADRTVNVICHLDDDG